MHRWICWSWIPTLALVLAPVLATAASAQRVLHVTIEGDLDSTKLASEFVDLLIDPPDAIVIETGANAWRRDVLWQIVDGARQSQARLIVLLHDRKDGRFGMGAMLLALLADAGAIGPRTKLAIEPTDDATGLAPPTTDWERVDREMSGLIWVSLKRRGVDPAIGEILLRGSNSLWVADNPAGLPEIVAEPPPTDARRLLERRADGTVRGGLATADLLTLGMIDLEAGDARELLREESLSGVRVERVRLRNEVSPTREQILTAITRLDEAIADIEGHFDSVRYPPDDRVVPPSAYRRAARDAGPSLDAIRALLSQTERLFDDHPELLATPAPEGTPVGRTPEGNVSDWRRVFLDRRRELARLEDRARDYARR